MNPKNIQIVGVALFVIFILYLFPRENYERCLNQVKDCKTDACVVLIYKKCQNKYPENNVSVPEAESQKQKDLDIALKRSFEQNQYRQNIQIISSEMIFEKNILGNLRYLLVEIKNNGDKSLKSLSLKILYFTENDFFISSEILKCPNEILANTSEKVRLGQLFYGADAQKYRIEIESFSFYFQTAP